MSTDPTTTPDHARLAAEAVADYWSSQLTAEMVKFDNGDPDGMASLLATMSRAGTNVSPEQVATFRDEIIRQIMEYGVGYIRHAVDYGPGYELRMALDAAGIRVTSTLLPWKTFTVVRNRTTATVYEGYGAEGRVLYAPPSTQSAPTDP